MGSSLRVAALGPDNEVMLRQLPGLFRKAYSNDYVIPDVYQVQFWKSHIGQRLTSLVVLDDREVVGHISVGKDFISSGEIALSHFALDPTSPDLRNYVPGLLANVVHTQALRNSWGFVYSLIPVENPLLFESFAPFLEMTKVAYCPSYFPGSSDKRRDAWISQSLFDCESFQPEIFVPQSYEALCKEIVDRLGTSRIVRTEATRRPALKTASDVSGLEQSCFQRQGVRVSFVHPSLLTDTSYLPESELVSQEFLLIDCRDPQTLTMLETIEKYGYTMCGMFPRLKGSDYLVYSSSPVAENQLMELAPVYQEMKAKLQESEGTTSTNQSWDKSTDRIEEYEA